jgi:hypothetical protein
MQQQVQMMTPKALCSLAAFKAWMWGGVGEGRALGGGTVRSMIVLRALPMHSHMREPLRHLASTTAAAVRNANTMVALLQVCLKHTP